MAQKIKIKMHSRIRLVWSVMTRPVSSAITSAAPEETSAELMAMPKATMKTMDQFTLANASRWGRMPRTR